MLPARSPSRYFPAVMLIRNFFLGWSPRQRSRLPIAINNLSPQNREERKSPSRTTQSPSGSPLPQKPAEQNLRTRARDEAANLRGARGILVRPHDRRAEPVWFLHDGCIGDHDPLPVEPNAIPPVLRIPVDVLHACAVGKRAA